MSKSRLSKILFLRSFIYALINLLPSGVALAVMPLITLKMSLTDYGVAGLYLSIIAGMLSSMEFSLLVRKAYVHHEQGEKLSESLSACGAVYTLMIGLLTLAAMLGWNWVSGFVPLSRGWALMAIITAGMQAVIALNFSLLQISLRVKLYCYLKLVFTFGYPLLALAGLFTLNMGWEALAYASLLATIMTVLISGWKVKQMFGLHWVLGRPVFMATLKSMASLTPFRLALAIFTYTGPFLVAFAGGTEQSGLYIFAFQICNVIGLVYDSILMALLPHMVAHHKQGNAHGFDRVTRRAFALGYIVLICVTSVGLVVIAPFVVGLLFPAAYGAAVPFIGWIALARCFHGINRINQELSFFDTDSFRRIALVSFFAALLYVLLTLRLLQVYGPLGAGMGLAAGHGLWLLLLFGARPWLIKRTAR